MTEGSLLLYKPAERRRRRRSVKRVMVKRGIPAILIAVLIVSCARPAKFVYPPSERPLRRISEEPKYGLRVAVLPFEEMRADRNSMKTYWLCFLPLAPFGFWKFERPDSARFFNTVSEFEFDVNRDVAKAVMTSLRESGLFAHVYFASAGETENADLIVSGRVNRTLYRGRTFTYCVSVAGAALWVVGLPVGDSTDELEFALEVKDGRSGKGIWGCKSRSSKRVVQGFYYRWGDDVKGFAELMEGAMGEIAAKLDQAMGTYERERRSMKPPPSLAEDGVTR